MPCGVLCYTNWYEATGMFVLCGVILVEGPKRPCWIWVARGRAAFFRQVHGRCQKPTTKSSF